jgi:putative DNA primase/helicase
MVYNSTLGTWETDEQGPKAGKMAMTLQRAVYLYAGEQSESYMKYAVGLASSKRRETMLKDASRFYPVSDGDLDRNPRLLNCRNVVLDLEHRKVLDHSPDLLLTKCAGAEYNPEADGERWNRFVGELMSGDPDKISYLQQVFGIALDGGIRVKRMFFLWGPTTNNGKSTLLEAFLAVCGDYGTAARCETFTENSDSSGSKPNEDVARLRGVRFVAVSEYKKRAILDAATCKKITGGVQLTARFLNQGSFTFLPQFTILNECNSLPQINDLTMFASGRVSVIRFDREFKPDTPGTNPRLLDELQEPESLSAALNWALEGLSNYHRAGDRLIEPEIVKAAVSEYQEASDKMGQFVRDCLIEQRGVNTAAGEAYNTYSFWCGANGYGVQNKANFFADLKGKGLLKASGTVGGKTVRNVIPNHTLDTDSWGRPKGNPFAS